MASKLDIIKTLFDEFIQENKKSTITGLDKKQKLKINASVFDFQAHVFNALNSEELNLNLNPKFISENIKKSFDQDCLPISINSYCLCFFDFLCVNKNKQKELYELIDDFLKAHLDELNWKDIFIMSSGATRCSANLRFALNELRNWNLIKKNDRTITPTYFGELIFHQFRKELNFVENDKIENQDENLIHDPITNEQLKIRNLSFEVLFKLISKFKLVSNSESNLIVEYSKKMQWDENGKEVLEILKDLDYFLKNAKITNEGILKG